MPAPAPTKEEAPIAAPQIKPTLGGGYQDIKWGSSRKVVRARFKARGSIRDYGDSKDELSVRLRDGTSLDFQFFDDHLFRVTYHPSFGNADRDRPALAKALLDKFGNPTAVNGMIDPLGLPLGILRWADEEMLIDLRWYPEPPQGVSSGGSVVYENVVIARQKVERRAAEEAKKAHQAQDTVNQHL